MQNDKQPPVSSNQTYNIVTDIPIATQTTVQPHSEDDELDNIMRDVGRGMKQVDLPKTKHHWFVRQEKPKSAPKLSAQPVKQSTTQTAPLPSKGAPTKQAIKAGPVKTSQTPVGVVALAIVVAFSLIAAAYFAYK